MLQSPRRPCNIGNLKIVINDTTLSRIGSNATEQSTKFLGLYIDEFLTWKHHIAHVNSKISRALFVIKQAKNVLPIENLKTLYYALIHPHISYGILAWGNANAGLLKKTTLLQKRALRIINKASYNSHTEPLFSGSDILKLCDLHKLEIATFMYDFDVNKLPSSFNDIFRKNHGTRDVLTRQSNLLYEDRCHSSFASKLPLYWFPKVWNKWVRTIPNCRSRSQFKRGTKQKLLSQYAITVKCKNRYCRDCFHV